MYYFNYVHKLRPTVDPEYFSFGRAMHRLIEQSNRDPEATSEVPEDTLPSTMPYHLAALRILLQEHSSHWAENNRSISWGASEQPFDISIVNPATNRPMRNFTLRGRPDCAITLDNGTQALYELKTTSSDIDPTSKQGANVWTRLILDFQISVYLLAARRQLPTIQTVLYDVIRKPSPKPHIVPLTDENGLKIVLDAAGQRAINQRGGAFRQTASKEQGYVLQTRPETVEEYSIRIQEAISKDPTIWFRRSSISRTDQEIEDVASEILQAAHILRAAHHENRWPRHDHSCIGFTPCRWLPICLAGGWSPGDPIPEGFSITQEAAENGKEVQ